MIEIADKSQCCGCSACVQICPKQCITLHEDGEGFLYPKIQKALCVDCHLCEKTCPVINQGASRLPLKVFAAKSPDAEIKRQSSSGGIFSMLAESVINKGGVVFGARWGENYHLVHGYTETIDGLRYLRGSKYLQSEIGDTFTEVETFLRQDRYVLFSGTPCQIAGLRRFLRKDYEHLILVDFICHGVPSPDVFRQYMKENEQLVGEADKKFRFASLLESPDGSEIDSLQQPVVYFRDKSFGWKKFRFAFHLKAAESGSNTVLPSTKKASLRVASEAQSLGFRRNPQNLLGGKHFTLWKKLPEVLEWREGDDIVYSNDLNQNIFMRAFLKNIILRPSCYSCPSKNLKSGSDITLGDYWGINTLRPELDDDKGVSAVTVNTKKGDNALKLISPELCPTTYEELVLRNPALYRSSIPHQKREAFFNQSNWSIHQRVLVYTQPSMYKRLRGCVSSLMSRLMPKAVETLLHK